MRIIEREKAFDQTPASAQKHAQSVLDEVYPNGITGPVELRRVARHLGVSLWSFPVDRRVEMTGRERPNGERKLRIEAPTYRTDPYQRYQIARCLGVSFTPVAQRTGQVFPVLTERGSDDLAIQSDWFAEAFALALLIPLNALLSNWSKSQFALAQTFGVKVSHIQARIEMVQDLGLTQNLRRRK